MKRVVLDASALIAAICSPHPRSASRVVVRAIQLGVVRAFASEAIRQEWREAVRHPRVAARARVRDPEGFVEAMCRVSETVEAAPPPIALPDPDDEMYLATTLSAGVSHLITFNVRDFLPAGRGGRASEGRVLGVHVLEPGAFLRVLARPGRR